MIKNHLYSYWPKNGFIVFHTVSSSANAQNLHYDDIVLKNVLQEIFYSCNTGIKGIMELSHLLMALEKHFMRICIFLQFFLDSDKNNKHV